jgi:hypothetical protein
VATGHELWRTPITGIRGLTEAQKVSLCALGAFEETSVDR